MEYLFEWLQYQEKRVNRHHWGQAMLCNLDWDWDPSASLRRLFSVRMDVERKVSGHTATFSVNSEKGTTWTVKSPTAHACMPKEIRLAYKTEEGGVKYRMFLADSDLLAADDNETHNASGSCISDPGDSPPPSEPLLGERGTGLSVHALSSGSGLEYVGVLEYREINRHARRKIETWLNSGWSVSWEWNGQYLWEGPMHWMNLTRIEADGIRPSPSDGKVKLEFPKTPNLELDEDSDSESDLDWDLGSASWW